MGSQINLSCHTETRPEIDLLTESTRSLSQQCSPTFFKGLTRTLGK